MAEENIKESKGSGILLDIYNSIKIRDKTKDIKEKLNLSNSLFSYYIRRLINLGLVQKIGYGIYEATSQISPKVAITRGHGFMWKVKTPPRNWIKLLNESKLNYKLIGISKTISILFKERKIWLGKKHIIIYEPESFIGINAIESKKFAVYRLIEILESLESKLNISLKPFEFQVKRQHYSLIKNCLAIQCNKLGQKIQVFNQKGLWFLIDNSFNLNECEQVHPETALIDSLGVQKYFNEHKETKFEVTPKFILNVMNGIQQNQIIFDKNMSSHISAIQELGKGVKKLTRVMKGILIENMDLKLSNKHQKTLGEFIR